MPLVGSGCGVVGRAAGVGKMPCPRRLVHSLGSSHAPQDSRSSRRASTHARVAVLHGSGLAAAPQGTWAGTVLRVCTGELSAATTEAAAKTEATKAQGAQASMLVSPSPPDRTRRPRSQCWMVRMGSREGSAGGGARSSPRIDPTPRAMISSQ